MSEIFLDRPDIFKRPSLDWLVYAETRRSQPKGLYGNVSDSGVILSRENHELTGSPIEYDEWAILERDAVRDRVGFLRHTLNITELARPRIEHGVQMVNLDENMATVKDSLPLADRAFADAMFTSTPGYGSIIAPADCIVATVAFPEERAVGQIHAGIRGLASGVISKALRAFEDDGLDIDTALVYVAPHAQGGFQMNLDETNEVFQRATTESHERVEELEHFLLEGKANLPKLDLTRFALYQFVQSGVGDHNIQISPQNTLTDDTLFSDLMKVEKKGNGRFGVVAGISASTKSPFPQD